MNGADDLRTAISTEIYEEGVYRDGPDSKPIMWWDCADAAMRVIERWASDPVRRLAILSLIGEVREGWQGTEAIYWQDDPTLNLTSVFVVRPRGEATDA